MYCTEITPDFYYEVDENENSIVWNDLKAELQTVLSFRFKDRDAAKNLMVTISISLIQTQKKQNLEKILKENKDWGQYFATFDDLEEQEGDDADNLADYEDYYDQNRMGIEFNNSELYQKAPDSEFTNSTLSLAKCMDRSFVSQGPIVNVYRTEVDNEDNLEVLIYYLVYMRIAQTKYS